MCTSVPGRAARLPAALLLATLIPFAAAAQQETGVSTSDRSAGAPPSPAAARAALQDAGGWDGPRARELARRAIEARRHAYADSTLRRFRARAQGHVYFLGEFGGERRVVRADQVALDVRWEAPDRALQLLVGRRHEKHLPTNIRYHIDHLSLVLDNFGDRIRLGEGEEVRDVLHPAAPAASELYEYRLADSLELRMAGRAFRLYRLDVRPRDPHDPGVVGGMFVDRGSGAIVRLRCTFTRAAYRDPAVQHIRVDLESALWEGRWWLPAEQEVEVRRQVSWLSFPAAGIIRTRLRVQDYRINGPDEAWSLGPGERVASLPSDSLAAFGDWERPLHAGPSEARAGSEEDAERLRARARELATPSSLLGTVGLRAHLPRASDALRARRAEGLLVGGGGAYSSGAYRLEGWAGYGFGRERPEVELVAARSLGGGGAELELRAFSDRLADVGPFPASAGLVSSLAMALDGEDYTDPYFEDGAELLLRAPVGGAEVRAGVGWARHQRAVLVADGMGSVASRPVRPVRPGDLASLQAGARLGRGPDDPSGWRLRADWEAGLDGPGNFGFTRALLRADLVAGDPGSPWGGRLEAAAGVATGTLPPQRLFLLGGRGTLPGHPFRAWGGDRIALLRGEVSRDLADPWVRLRAGAAAGWSGVGAAARAAARDFGATATGGAEASASVGVGLLYDVLRLDLARGLTGGGWGLLFSVDPSFWGML